MAENPKAMVSSMAAIHAERELIADDLRRLFDTVIQAPETSAAGSRADDYVDHAGSSHFMVVLLGQQSRGAVLQEIDAAHRSGCHVAAFALHYPPFLEHGKQWEATPEELAIKNRGTFLKSVSFITDLRREVDRAVALYIARSANRLEVKDFRQNYATALKWLALGVIKRVALVQRTSILVLGARKEQGEERETLKEIRSILQNLSRRPGLEFVHVFDKSATLSEAKTNGHLYELGGGLSNNQISGYVSKRRQRVHFSGVENGILSSILLVNDRVGMSVPLASGGSKVVLIDDARIATEFFSDLKQNAHGNVDTTYLLDVHDAISSHHTRPR